MKKFKLKNKKVSEAIVTKEVTLYGALEMMMDTEMGCSREDAIFTIYKDDLITKEVVRHIIGNKVDDF